MAQPHLPSGLLGQARPSRAQPRYNLAIDSWWIEPDRVGAVEQGKREAQQSKP
ncbi:hypothetical protein [Dankookia sp. P2]|uniref:hypothetical protein n=1 Tax=Dankookia sp. P2 TaxID=3423955 RepID=UPI003D67805C